MLCVLQVWARDETRQAAGTAVVAGVVVDVAVIAQDVVADVALALIEETVFVYMSVTCLSAAVPKI